MHPVMFAADHQPASLLWQYIGSFTLYTLLAIGAIYAAFLYLKKHPRLLDTLQQRQQTRQKKGGSPALMHFLQKSLHLKQQPALQSAQPGGGLAIESTLPLELQRTLYVIRAGRERFLIATSDQGTQLLARLEEDPPQNGPSARTPDATEAPQPANPEPETDAGQNASRKAACWFGTPRDLTPHNVNGLA